jgi:hypothetical protein
LANPRIQVDSWADSYDVAQALGKQVRMALDGYASDGVYSLILGEHDLMDPDGPRQRVTQDYSVWVDE